MKHFLVSVILTLVSICLYSQDVIIGNDGTSEDGEKAISVCMNPGFSDLNIWLCDLSSNTMTT